ncbi:MAG: ATP-dependent helicase HrpB [Bryobacteraceae bacterium]|nr:ATP-dependent helicase HrpB [Bryobacteraceae bacterium]
MTPLPIDTLLPEIVSTLKEWNCVVLEAPPGAGKTTRVPAALLDAGYVETVVLEPRRIAARMAARRVSAERGETVGRTVGYQVRLEQAASEATRLRFLTEGVLTRRLLADPLLKGVECVVLDEFHERHLEGDLALALLRRLQARRPDLRLVVMSATLQGEALARHMGGCPVLRSEGRLYPLEIGYTPHSTDRLDAQVAEAVAGIVKSEASGDVLVFLPGAAEIRASQRALEGLAAQKDLLVLPLHGDLSPEEQDRAVEPASRRKVILSTNVAESSITIEGVRAVVDSGLARVASDSAYSGLQRVEVGRISRASATQRAGRAGRTGPGKVVRLYPEADFLRRPEYDTPEILRRELSGLVLDLAASGVDDPLKLEWLDGPPEAALNAARALLERLGAVDAAGRVTRDGRRMAGLPLHPRLAKLAVAAEARGAGDAGVAAAAALSAGARLTGAPAHPSPSDLLLLIETGMTSYARRLEQQLRRMARPRTSGGGDEAFQKAVLEAFPDRVARVSGGGSYRLAGGGSAQLARDSAQAGRKLIVAIEVEERRDAGAPLIRLASAVEPEWLLELFPERVEAASEARWNREAERVEQIDLLLYDGLPIDESRSHKVDSDEATALLAMKAIETGLHRICDAEAFEAFRQRLAFAAEHSDLRPVDDERLREAVEGLARGLRSMDELKERASEGGLEQAVVGAMGPEAKRTLDKLAPERIRLASGRMARVSYAEGQTPWVESRLQDFFGMKETPAVAGGRVRLVVHLLAPSYRPVQVTSDLEGFWERHYPAIRKELMRRYPKHKWPENPYTLSQV